MAAVLAPDAVVGTAAARPVVRVPEAFRLRDENPFTRRPYTASSHRDLPVHIARAITAAFGISARGWDDLVFGPDGVPAALDIDRTVSLRTFLYDVRAGRHGRRDGCEDCSGRGAVADVGGELTGDPDAVVLCACAAYALARRPARADGRLTRSCHERGWL